MNQGLAWLVAALFAILPLAHVPALRNLLSLAAAILITAVLMRERRMPPLPAWPMSAWIALGAASALWSADPAATLHGVLYSMLLPAGVFLAAWRVAANDRAFDRLRWAAAAGVLCLGIMVALVFATGRPAATLLSDAGESSVIYYWPGVGVSSTFAALIVPFALFAIASGRRAERYAGAVSLAAAISVAMVSQNRIVWPSILVSCAAFIAWLWPALAPASRRLALAILCAAAVAAAGAFYYASLERRIAVPELGSDIRVQGWREWTGIALQRPLLGHGFGRVQVHLEGERGLAQSTKQREPHLASHAHNLFLDIAVQLGVLGLAIYLALLGVLLREYWRLGGAGAPGRLRLLGATAFSLLVAMIAKNSTDDFMDQAGVIAFWGYAGMLLGRLDPSSRS
ncbi:MAG TPA: O-antigen ligase family protein [Burkholderiales bacterium]|nr:O-antigen ligase family protein [Burkholderiales bacterium]